MGIDVEIYFEATDGERPTDLALPAGWTLHEVHDYERECGATHTISNLARYYSESYSRGPWVDICAVLMSLFASTNVGRVWYFGDCSGGPDDVHPITPDDVCRISRFYMLNGERPYRQRAPVVTEYQGPRASDSPTPADTRNNQQGNSPESEDV